MIKINNVSKVFKLSRKQMKDIGDGFSSRNLTAVDDVSLECKSGRIFCLLGPNGAGKTTLLRMIATMLKPTQGTISVNGFDTIKSPKSVRENLGFMSNNTALYDRLTTDEMVKYYADLNGMTKDEFQTRKEELFTLLDMHEFASRRIAKLSSGMKQKVSIARTMIHNPQVLIFDEPTTGLDVMTSRAIIQLIRNCKDDNKTVILSTHRLGEIQPLCDDLAIIHKSKLFFNNTFDVFKNDMQTDSFEDEFIRLTGEE
ncbi:MAG: ATP-binding cassette domain-containing protein [Candidatus Marinimicrobia bacterium]|nr:ATP-binding cassette domain-containing protein [Candidatus Neomarinimicrobiota bacterium]MBL7022472.1 ATP-binding cassette domain-containing protein [Candidatus Neomarinimicrobiota bacterium]MBL7108673.1 ATP-binding cassette domain-containing protein [Candidatus Neomarinimicrobiota bacterium]